MRLSYNWLKEFVDFTQSPKEIADLLTFNAVEANVVSSGAGWKGIVTAKVLERNAHPNADKLSLCSVTDGKNNYSVVCGAPNVAAGQIVALAVIGSELQGGFQIKKAKIRGVESEGMICSEKELGLSGEAAGIMVLPENTPLGKPLEQVIDASDSIIEIEITTNRPDCLSHWGVAREIAAKLGKPLKLPEINKTELPRGLKITIENPDLCSRYIGYLINGVEVKPSPDWLAKKLERCGIRPINNIVDITNYVLIELGHPLHAFDTGVMAKGEVVVRTAKKGEKILALDGKEYPLTETMLVIADAEKAQAIAGVMGGENSGVTQKTKNIILESAVFLPKSIRRTSKALALSTDASYRFERGISWEGAELAAWRAMNLIVQLAGGKPAHRTDKIAAEYKPAKIVLRPNKVSQLLGMEIPDPEIRRILESLGMKINPVRSPISSDIGSPKMGLTSNGVKCAETDFQVEPPSWRLDIAQEVDLIEEVARINGYDKIPTTIAPITLDPDKGREEKSAEAVISERLIALGFSETLNYSFLEEKSLLNLGLPVIERISNPISKENEVLRTSLLPGMLKNFILNKFLGNNDVKLFETGNVFLQEGEKRYLGALFSGKIRPEWWAEKEKESADAGFYFMKGAVQDALSGNNIVCHAEGKLPPFMHPGKSCSVRVNGKEAGFFGVLFSADVPELTESTVYYTELDLEILNKVWNRKTGQYKTLIRFPSVKRDLSIMASNYIAFDKVSGLLADFARKNVILSEFELTDVYRDAAKIGKDNTSYTLHLAFRHSERTLTDTEVNKSVDEIVAALKNELGATLR
ncbi:MAG: phenylalanine--tRNA ligase subunit beta [Elusimicrobiota bacterium]